MWLQHLFGFLGTVVHVFVNAIGSTVLGIVLDIVFASAIAVVTLSKIRQQQGFIAMLKHWRVEYKSTMKFTLWAALVIYGPVAVWSVGSAVYADHNGLVDRSRSLRSTIRQDSENLQTTKNDFNKQLSDTKIECAGFKGENNSLSKQNRDQQNTINNCQSEATKLLAPAEQKTTAILFDNDVVNKIKRTRILLLTNKAESPVRMRIACDNVYLEAVALSPLASASVGGGASRLGPNAFETSVMSPAWTPTVPFIATVDYTGDETLICHFALR